jgi:hypothetical protein
MNRITDSVLQARVDYLNKLVGAPLEQWVQKDGGSESQLGNFNLNHAYGGVCLMRITNNGGGCSMPLMSSHTTKRDCYDQISAFIKGIEYQQHLSTKLSGE